MTCTHPHSDPQWIEDGGLPAFLCHSCLPAQPWSAPKCVASTPIKEDWQLRRDRVRDMKAAEKKAKNARNLARLKEKHEGERYDRKEKKWLPI